MLPKNIEGTAYVVLPLASEYEAEPVSWHFSFHALAGTPWSRSDGCVDVDAPGEPPTDDEEPPFGSHARAAAAHELSTAAGLGERDAFCVEGVAQADNATSATATDVARNAF
jgi:hypothetical protein